MRGDRGGEGHGLVPVVGAGARVVRAQHGDGRPVGRAGPRVEDRGQLGAAVVRVDHRPVRGAGRAGPGQGEEDTEPGRRHVPLLGHGLRRDRRQPRRGHPGDDEVRLGDGPVGQPHPGRPAVLLDEADGLRAEEELHAPRHAPLVERVRQPAHAAAHVPAAEGLLHVRQHGRARGGAARVEAVGEGVALQESDEPGVLQLPRGDGGQGGGHVPPEQAASAHRRVRVVAQGLDALGAQRLLQQGAPRRVPHLARAVHQLAPALARAGTDGGVERGDDAGARGVGQGDVRAVREEMTARRVDLDQVQALLQRLLAGLDEQVAVDGGQVQQPRPGVEDEPVPLEPPDGAAVRLGALVHRDPMPGNGQARGGRHGAHSGADHHNPSHAH